MHPPRHAKNPTDISIIPDGLAPYPDDTVHQSSILDEIIGTSLHGLSSEEHFNKLPARNLKLSRLKSLYENKDKNALNLLSTRHTVLIDDKFQIPLGNSQAIMNTDESMIDYHLTVANCVGLSPLLPNTSSDHRFCFSMDLQKPYLSFKGKHAMLGFDPAGSMLFMGQSQNEDVFLAMAPNQFLQGHTELPAPGHSTASPLMSRRHYRQVVMMMAHFLALLPQRAYLNTCGVYRQDLDSSKPQFENITNVLYVFALYPNPSSHSFLSLFHPILNVYMSRHCQLSDR